MAYKKNLNPKEKMKRARVQMYREMPFFGYLCQYLTLVETDKVPTAAISEDTRVFYNPDFVDSLSEGEIEGLLAHEVMHKAMNGFSRQGYRDDQKWNVAQDLIINHILKNENGFELPEEGLIPDENGTFDPEEADYKIEDLGDKNFETVYDLIPSNESDDGGFDIHIKVEGSGGEGGSGEGDSDGEGDGDTVTVTISGGDGDEELEEEVADEINENGEIEIEMSEEDWKSAVAQAQQHASSQGKEPGGVEELMDVKREGEVDYKKIISQTISSNVPSDFTFTRPSKASRAVGSYLPSIREDEGLDVIVALDTSGSVHDALLERFIGEVKNLVDTFESTNLTIIQHDASVQSVEEHTNARSSEFDEFEVKGRGGTSHVPVFEEIEENHIQNGPTVFIGLTDGYTTVPEEIPALEDVIWVLNNHAVDLDRLKHGQIVRIDPEEG